MMHCLELIIETNKLNNKMHYPNDRYGVYALYHLF